MLISTDVSGSIQIAPAAYSVSAVFIWGSSDFLGGLGCRRANAFVLTAFSHLCAFTLMLGLALQQHAVFPSRSSMGWAVLAGALGGFSLAIFYRALAQGKMGLTAPIAALLGAAIPTLADIAMEGAPGPWTFVGFALAILALWLITRPEEGSARPEGVGMAALAGIGFAGFYLCIHQATSGSPLWIAAVSRVGSFTATAVAVVVTRAPLVLDRPAATMGALAGFLDISASALFIVASQHGRLDEAVVITSLYPAMTVVLARIFLKEHFTRWKFVGLLAALAAVPMIAAG
jgi:drug/metabolite transporter (DMT)-like permease